ncbi:MAG: hypothetical protein LBK73_01115 [Treponema sp.]|nr:hypothetical protein [Treponema sp.]
MAEEIRTAWRRVGGRKGASSSPVHAAAQEEVPDRKDGGMTAYACCRYDKQKGGVGQWSPVASVLIP